MAQNPIDEIKQTEADCQKKIQAAQKNSQQKISQFKAQQENLLDNLEEKLDNEVKELATQIQENNQQIQNQNKKAFEENLQILEKISDSKINQAKKLVLESIDINKS